MSQGLITRETEISEYLKQISYECVIVDEAHRARRKKIGPHPENHKPDPNNLLAFLLDIACHTKSLLLATATPVQLHPIEVFDLMTVLAVGNDSVLGNEMSGWRNPRFALDLVMGKDELPDDDLARWRWIRNPLPPAGEGRDFELIRRSLGMPDSQAVAPGDTWMRLRELDRDRVRRLARNFAREHNPFIRHIIRRTREYLEQTINPATKEPYLKPVAVKLLGDNEADAIKLPPYLQDAFDLAEKFCDLLKERIQAAGFIKTLLLRRMGSTIYAGKVTVERMLDGWGGVEEEECDDEDIYNMRYKGSVEDRVHELLSDRLEDIYRLFGQIPDVLDDVWISVALGDIERARQIIDAVPRQHPFDIRYNRIEHVPWESCSKVLDSSERRKHLMKGWQP